jgi:hypothetical protein
LLLRSENKANILKPIVSVPNWLPTKKIRRWILSLLYVAGILYQGLRGQKTHLTINDSPTNQTTEIIGSIQLGLLVSGRIPRAGSIPKRSIAQIAAGIIAVNTNIRDTVSLNALARSLYTPCGCFPCQEITNPACLQYTNIPFP